VTAVLAAVQGAPLLVNASADASLPLLHTTTYGSGSGTAWW
jgi:hypothetical protein